MILSEARAGSSGAMMEHTSRPRSKEGFCERQSWKAGVSGVETNTGRRGFVYLSTANQSR